MLTIGAIRVFAFPRCARCGPGARSAWRGASRSRARSGTGTSRSGRARTRRSRSTSRTSLSSITELSLVCGHTCAHSHTVPVPVHIPIPTRPFIFEGRPAWAHSTRPFWPDPEGPNRHLGVFAARPSWLCQETHGLGARPPAPPFSKPPSKPDARANHPSRAQPWNPAFQCGGHPSRSSHILPYYTHTQHTTTSHEPHTTLLM